jgi:ankyrin repeat protein
MSGHCDVVECLLSSGADVNLRCEDGKSPLFIASQHGRCDVVKCLFSSGADIQCPFSDATNNCDCPRLSYKLTSAPELSKHLTTL